MHWTRSIGIFALIELSFINNFCVFYFYFHSDSKLKRISQANFIDTTALSNIFHRMSLINSNQLKILRRSLRSRNKLGCERFNVLVCDGNSRMFLLQDLTMRTATTVQKASVQHHQNDRFASKLLLWLRAEKLKREKRRLLNSSRGIIWMCSVLERISTKLCTRKFNITWSPLPFWRSRSRHWFATDF